jgi:hypothetical protein
MMKLMVWISFFVLSSGAWAASDDDAETETEEASIEEIAAEAKALELLGEGSDLGAPEAGVGADDLLEIARDELSVNPTSTLPMEPTPSVLDQFYGVQTVDVPSSVRKEAPPVVKELVPEKSPIKPGQGSALVQGQGWRHQYHSGRTLSSMGLRMGRVGTALVLGAVPLAVVSEELYIIHAVIGLGTIWAGSGVTAAGTYRSHAALAKGGLVTRGCVGCLGSWVTAIHPFTSPFSYLFSMAHRASDAKVYRGKAEGPVSSSSIRVSPVMTRLGPGLGLNGTF